MPRSNFYWETSGEAVKRKDRGGRPLIAHIRLSNRREGVRGLEGTVKAQIPFSPLNSFIHLFVPSPSCLIPLAHSLSVCPQPPYIIVPSVFKQRFTDSGPNSFTSDRQYQPDQLLDTLLKIPARL